MFRIMLTNILSCTTHLQFPNRFYMVGIFIIEYLHLIFFSAFGLSNENLFGTTETGKKNKMMI